MATRSEEAIRRTEATVVLLLTHEDFASGVWVLAGNEAEKTATKTTSAKFPLLSLVGCATWRRMVGK